ncbi:hypothetical protein D9619_007983 [Psilocybe cf. subviscida]|uniref:F-box domain-containing protein n=1 Tax=Psilocybe cf. subviscida TaxID=2480587 RepID=A0A8H5AU94_9AGAR|nr:hypothetical protein D9619_007983 [Psilocybe cf. subviscida]
MNPSSPAPSELTLASTLDGRDVTNDVDNSPVKAEPGETSVPVQGSGEPVTTTVVTEAVDSSPPNKKTRLETKDGDQGVEVPNAPKTPGFLKLPLELLSDILIRAGSPEYLLAVARTCKSLCHTLLSRDAEFIWREARQSPSIVYQHEITTCKLPDPPAEFFSEAAYAAFVFSSGKCDVCSQETSVPYSSFAIRVRLCKKKDCNMPGYEPSPHLVPRSNTPASTVTELTTHRSPMGAHLREILPTSEVSNLKNPGLAPPNPVGYDLCRSSSLAATELEWELNRNKPSYHVLCVQLAKWRNARIAHYHKNKAANEKLGRNIASKYGWDYKEALTATSFGVYHSRQNRLMEAMHELDIQILKDQVEDELLSHVERVERRKTERTLMTNRKDVETLYRQLRSKGGSKFMPSLSTFRQLPVIAMLQSAESSASASVAQTLSSNEVMQKLLDTQLKKWTEKAMQDLGYTLGFPKNWKNASKNILHPVERVTARFLCKKCQRVDVKYRDDESLDFAGACLHECGIGNTKKGRVHRGRRNVWESSKFVKDDKATKVLQKCVEGLNFPEDKDAGNYILSTGIAVVCTSCNPAMVIDTRNIIGHSHRHDNMQVKFETLQTVENYLGPHPYEYGVCKTLLGPSNATPTTKAEIDRKNYGCRHCLREEQEKQAALAAAAAPTDAAPDAHAADGHGAPMDVDGNAKIDLGSVVSRLQEVGIAGPKEQPPPLFSFNGMRSHLKAKHAIVYIRDEDIFCYEPFNLAT